MVQAALDAIGQQLQAWTDVAHDLALREVNPLDVRRRIADMDHLRAFRAHDEGRLLDRIVTDRDDQVGAIDGLMDVVALAQRSRSHVKLAAAGDRSLAHLRREEWNLGTPDEAADPRGAARTRCRGAEHNQRPFGLEDHFGGAIQRRPMSHGNFDRVLRYHRDRLGFFARDIFR